MAFVIVDSYDEPDEIFLSELAQDMRDNGCEDEEFISETIETIKNYKHTEGGSVMTKVHSGPYKTDSEVRNAIQKLYPELSGAGQNLLRLEVYLRSIGSSCEKIMDSMRVKDSPFLKLLTR